jgi:hypothetical protein
LQSTTVPIRPFQKQLFRLVKLCIKIGRLMRLTNSATVHICQRSSSFQFGYRTYVSGPVHFNSATVHICQRSSSFQFGYCTYMSAVQFISIRLPYIYVSSPVHFNFHNRFPEYSSRVVGEKAHISNVGRTAEYPS